MHAFFGDLAQVTEAEHLEAARIGQDRLVPADEVVQATEGADDIKARSQPQVKGVAKDDLGTGFVQAVGRHGLDGAVGSNRHENRGFDGAVVEAECSATGVTAGFVQGKFEHEEG